MGRTLGVCWLYSAMVMSPTLVCKTTPSGTPPLAAGVAAVPPVDGCEDADGCAEPEDAGDDEEDSS